MGSLIHIIADPNKRIPKYCTSVLFAKMKNGQIILTFVENDEAIKAESSDHGVIIERILVDEEHARQIVEKLGGLITKAEETKL
ncbi:MAG: hypothetical protein ABIB04_02500 [Patescibacteria group bacterium]